MEEYKVSLHTSSRYLTGGTVCAVMLKLVGRTGVSTEWHQVGKTSLFSRYFKRGSVEEFSLQHEGEKLGCPTVVTLSGSKFSDIRIQQAIIGQLVIRVCKQIEQHIKDQELLDRWIDSWLCDKVLVTYDGIQYEFPAYDWVDENEMTLLQGNATLPQNVDCELVRSLRANEVRSSMTKFEWCPAPQEGDVGSGLPRFMNARNFLELPKVFLRTYSHMKHIGGSGLEVAINAGTNIMRSLFKSIKSLDDYKKLYKHLGYKDPSFIDDWMKDEEMGRQVLNGISPLAFERCRSLPEYCDVTDRDVIGLLPNESSLEQEIERGTIYIADYTYIKNIQRNKCSSTGKSLVCADCLCLFYSDQETGDFLPIAIQLIPSSRESLFTPNDSFYDWMLAKMHFRSTMTSMHEWQYHYLHTHAVSETFCIATLRCFARSHPVYKLLRPHLTTVPTINTDARVVIMPGNSLANKCHGLNSLSALRHCFKTFHFSQLDIPTLLKSKGTDDKMLLPTYYYRDDALRVWKAIDTYVNSVLRLFYKNDQDVCRDYELQAWAFDFTHEGFAWFDGDTRGFPDKLTSVESLVHLCTIIIFTSSVQHAAVNFGQMETYQFVPNSPGCMRLPVHKKGEGSLELILDSLPSVASATIFISFSYSLSHYMNEEIFLGQVQEPLFVEEQVKLIQKQFQSDLVALGKVFAARNSSQKHPYTFLLPDRIPNSIAL